MIVIIVCVCLHVHCDVSAAALCRKFGSRKWQFAPTKSIVGTAAFACGGFLSSCALLALFNYTGSDMS